MPNKRTSKWPDFSLDRGQPGGGNWIGHEDDDVWTRGGF
jgi:hypothetical protein